MKLCLAVTILIASSGVRAATIVNASFETPFLGSGFQYNPPGATWTFLGNSGIAGNGSAWGFAPAPDGTQVAFLQVSGTTSSSFSQTISAVAPGDRISFFHAQRPGYGINSYDVLYNSTLLGSFSPASTTFVQVSVVIPGGAPSSGTLLFQSTGATGGDRGTGIDALTVTAAAIPEPASLVLFAPALALLTLRRFL
jgi:hypothetical protein